MSAERRIALVIHNVRSAANVGSMLRTADGAGVTEVWLTGYTPVPASPGCRYLTRAEKSLAKAALGAEYAVSWRRSRTIGAALKRLHTEGYRLVVVEQSDRSVSLDTVSRMPGDVAIIVGNEVLGIDTRILNRCDAIAELPMHGQKHSLNVSVAAGIALYVIRGTIEKTKTL